MSTCTARAALTLSLTLARNPLPPTLPRCAEWIRTEKPLQKPKEGWEFANDPTKFALWDDDLGDQDFG